MARISEKNKRYRTKEQIVSDLTFALNSPLSYAAKLAVLKDATWVWTEYAGKYEGCEWWSHGAIMQHKLNGNEKGLIHEHAVPRKVVMKMPFDLQPATEAEVERICEAFLVGIVVIKEEDAVLNEYRDSMPAEFFDSASAEYNDPFLRYKRCGINLKQMCWIEDE